MKKQRKGIIMTGILGVFLLSAWLWTGGQGISKEEQKIYEDAVSMEEQVDKLGFEGFCLSDYPVAIYDGVSDYVFYKGKIKKRPPVIETFVGTAYPVGDHFEVIVPTLERFESLMSLAGGAEGMMTGSGYGAEEHKGMLWHEAFHAYQLTNFAILGEKVTPKEMQEELEGAEGKEESEISQEEQLVTWVDQAPDIRSKLKQEMELLKKTVELIQNQDISAIDEVHRIILEYSERRRQRMSEMSEALRDAEIRCEVTEGTAYYVEAKVYGMMTGQEEYKERYLYNLGTYEGGRGKYYRTGFAKCLILDFLCPDWKETFDFSTGLDEVIEKYIEGES